MLDQIRYDHAIAQTRLSLSCTGCCHAVIDILALAQGRPRVFCSGFAPMSTGRAAALVLAAACAGCAGGHRYVSTWDGRRGYDGTGDYGYDLAASR